MNDLVPSAQVQQQLTHKHERRRVCRHCGRDCSRTALEELTYSWEPCDCEAAPYTHLVAQIWHRECFVAMQTAGEPVSDHSEAQR